MNSGDRVFIDPQQVLANQPERHLELKPFYYCRYLIHYCVDETLVMAVPLDTEDFYPNSLPLETAILSYAH